MTNYHQHLFTEYQSPSTQNADGIWQSGGNDALIYVGVCRYESSGKGSVINGSDGFHTSYSGIIYMPPTTWRVEDGQMLCIAADKVGTNILRKVKVVSSDYGRLHTRLWVE